MSAVDLGKLPENDPIEIYRLRDGFYATDLLGAAVVYLNFFSWLAKQPSTLAEICHGLQITPRPTDVMLTLFTALGLIERGAGRFHVTELAREQLVDTSPWYVGPYFAALKDRPVCKDFHNVLRTGRAANWGSFQNEKDWVAAMADEGFARQFTAAMDCRGRYLAPAMARRVDCRALTHLLDVAGGSGVYACAMLAQHPHLQATVLEKPPVDQVARRSIAERGFADRVKVQPGDMLREEFPGGCDLHLLSNVLHDWDEAVVGQLLHRSYRALRPGGLLLIHDAHINDDKSGPLAVAKYSALLMHSTEGKCYSLAELRGHLTTAGFVEMKFEETALDRSIVTARKPVS